LAPGSVHDSGQVYRWAPGGELGELDFAVAPQCLAQQDRCPGGTRFRAEPPTDPNGAARYWLDRSLGDARPGNRNDTGFNLACQLRDCGLDEARAEPWMRDYARRVPSADAEPYTEHDALASLHSAYTQPPREPAQRGKPISLPAVGGTAESKPQASTPAFKRTEIGNAERLAHRYRSTLRYCWPTRHWLVFDGVRWKKDEDGAVMRCAIRTARSIYQEARDAIDSAEAKELGSWAGKSESRSRLEAMVALARSYLAVAPDDLDADPFAFNCLNGTLDLRTGTLRPHDRGDLITNLAPVAYDPRAEAPRWMKFLDRVFASNGDLIGFVQRWLGMCLTGDVGEQYLVLFIGPGANGKSTLCDAVIELLGDYAGDAPPDLLTLRRGDDHPCGLTTLRGKRLVVASETERGQWLKLQLVKKLTGDRTITARHMHREWFDFKRTHKFVFQTNNAPRIPADDEAIWRRILRVPFDVVIPEEERDKALLEKLLNEGPGILRWIVEGCLAWQRDGLDAPMIVRDATEAYRAESDPLTDFLAECCVVGQGLRGRAGAFYGRYGDWAKDMGLAGEERLNHIQFGKLMAKRFKRCKGGSGKRYDGVALRGKEDPDAGGWERGD